MKHIRLLGISLLTIIPFFTSQAQKAISPLELEKWQRITKRIISNDGKWVATTFTPWRGDAEIQLYDVNGNLKKIYKPTTESKFSTSSEYFITREVPSLQQTDSLKLKKAKKDDMPMDKLIIRNLKKETEWKIDSLSNYSLAESGDWIAYRHTRSKDDVLHVESLNQKNKYEFLSVSAYGFAKKKNILYFVTKDTTDNKKPGLYIWNEKEEKPILIKEGKGDFIYPTFDKNGNNLAFLYTEKTKDNRELSVWHSRLDEKAKEIVTATTIGIPENWIISRNYRIFFSDDASRLFLGTSPEPMQKDTAMLPENRPNVQVWSWNEPVQYTVQHHNVNSNLKKSYAAVYLFDENKFIQIADSLLPNAQLPVKGIGEYAIISTSQPYSLSSMWEGRTRSDYYKISLNTGERTPISKADYASYSLSPANKYATAYNKTDSCWYAIILNDNRKIRLSSPDTFIAWNEENDMPDYPSSYGYAGWTQDDKNILIYDRYDIWSFDPEGIKKPVRLTNNGRENKITYRHIVLDSEQTYIKTNEQVLLKGFNEIDKTSAIYKTRLSSAKTPIPLLCKENYFIDNIDKAEKANKYIYTCENFETFPDVWISDDSFKEERRLTQGIKQQKPYIWGTAELISWTTADGKKSEGIIYKPSDFDAGKKYPMIVNFYERNSHNLHRYRMPEPNRSTIDYCMYLSNGYIIFNPDVHYRDGHPGESCFDCVMPGIDEVISRGYVDEKHIGAQGHSWGGYQVAYLATRTKRFAAIESGAPVVNMFSAYGGIRWGSGLARSFQYEHTQSRLGATPWSNPELYTENSPLFEMDKVETPILIMHNDQDGHVPWYQGIEYFVALKRLGKPAWLLNYTGEPHWPTKIPNRTDFQIRMKQFFDHYLKNEPMPKWMKDGVPAVKQPYELGY